MQWSTASGLLLASRSISDGGGDCETDETTALLTILIFVFITGQVWAHNPAAVRISDGLSLGLFVNASGELNSFGYRLLGFLNEHWSDDERLAVADSIGTDGLHLKIQADPYVFVQYNNFRVQGGGKAEGWAMVPQGTG